MALVDREDVGDLLAHEMRAGDHPVGPVRDPLLDAVDVLLRMLLDPALVAAVLGGVDRRDQRHVVAAGEVVAGAGHEPVVAVDEVEFVAVPELDPGGEHVGVHALDPGDELGQVGRAFRLDDAVDQHAGHLLLDRGLLPAPGQDVDFDAEADQGLGELAHVPGEPAFDQRRVFPGDDQDSVRGHGRAGLRGEQRGQAQVGGQ